MRKLYGFLLAIVMMCAVSTEMAHAYAITDYLVRTDATPWAEITGTHITGLESAPYYYNISPAIQVPFNFLFMDQQIATTNTFWVNGCGSVIFQPDWCGYPDYYGYSFYYTSGTYYDYDLYGSYYGSSYYCYYPKYKLMPLEALSYNNFSPGDFQWTVLGSSPNRQLVVQTKNRTGYYSGIVGSWQAVVFEAGISKFQFNYGPISGNNGTNYFGLNYSVYGYRYGAVTAVKGGPGYSFLTIGHNGGGAPVVAYNNVAYPDNGFGLAWPTVNYMIFIAWPEDLTASLITMPPDQSIQNLLTPLLSPNSFNPAVTIRNSGSSRPTGASVLYQISEAGVSAPVYSAIVSLSGLAVPASFASATVTFPTPFTIPAYGIYYDTVIVYNVTPNPPGDQNPVDNTTTNSWTCSPPDNIKAVTVLGPAPGTRSPVAVMTPISVRFKNIGANDQINVPLSVVVTDPTGAVVWRDTVIAPSIPSPNTSVPLSTYDATFLGVHSGEGQWVPAMNGIHKICGIALMSNDLLRADDTTCTNVLVSYEADVAGISVVNPQPDEEKPYTLSWQPTALFQSVGVSDLFDVPARVQIRKCGQTQIAFQADSIIPELNVDQNRVRFSFPSHQGPYDITRLTPGCYTICAIARYPTDGYRANDTACSTFTIIDRLKGNIYVGVGQRFQSIHAAVDSMIFRGIGGNLNLILSDANYTENGNNKISTPNGAVDFGHIRGLSDTSWVTWIPKVSVKPTITFTGNKPFCFYFGDLQGGHIKFEGYNPLGVPVPDKVVAEPNKRGITIIDNSTAAGGVFGVEEGASTLIFKDLVLKGNGSKPNSLLTGGLEFANDSDAVIRLYNEQNRFYYIGRVFDTVPIHNVRIENCEIGNAKYGLYDHGLHDQFELGPSRFKDWRNYGNVVTRNTIGTATSQIGYAGISFNSEKNMTISHNEISWVDNSLTQLANLSYAGPNAYGIVQASGSQITQPGTVQDSVGNVVNVAVNANRIRNISATQGNAYGIIFQQSATTYSTAGTQPVRSVLPVPTMNNTTNNMVLDLRAKSGSVYPLTYLTARTTYSTDRDSIFNNSITTSNATINIKLWNAQHAFLWNNVIQNTANAASYTNYSLQLPRPYASALSSDYNLFDLSVPTTPSTSTFAVIQEYDKPSGIPLGPSRTFRKLNDWRTYNQQDLHSVTGNPMFASDSLHMPNAFSYISSPASNDGAWLGTATQLYDFDGDQRLQGNGTPDIGADEFEGFQYSNDLAVLAITQPGGYSQLSDTSLVTLENPMWITATIKNLSAQAVFNRKVMTTVEVALNGGVWQTIYYNQTSNENWDVNESKNQAFQGPPITLTQAKTGVFRVTVWVANDQNHSNDSLAKVFRVLLKSNATVVTYNGLNPAGLQNRNAVYGALARLGITGYDTLDRNFYGSTDLDYSPWWTVIYVSGDPAVIPVSGEATGQAYLSYKETQEIEKYLNASQTYAKKSVIMAGQNIAFQHARGFPNNSVTDPEFLNSFMHTQYFSNVPVLGGWPNPPGGPYVGKIVGGYSDYWQFSDSINSASPDMIKPFKATPLVGPEVNWFAYSYAVHNISAADSGAGVTYYNPLYNTVFYGFDWSDPFITTPPEGSGPLTSGTTRVLKGALDFVTSHAGTILAVDFVNATATRSPNGTAADIKWETVRQEDVARFDIETLSSDNAWVNVGQVSVQKDNKYGFTDDGIDASAHHYRIAAVDLSGAKTYSDKLEVAPMAASGLRLEQNFPNPTTGVTSVRFTLPVAASVTLRLLDVTGKVMTTVFANEAMSAGNQSKTLDVSELASGSYIYELTAVDGNGQSITTSKKMTLNK